MARVPAVVVVLLGLPRLPRPRPTSLIAPLALPGLGSRLLLAVVRGLPAAPLLSLAVPALSAPLSVTALLASASLLSVAVALSTARLVGDQFAPVRVVHSLLSAVPVGRASIAAAAGRALGVQVAGRLSGLVVPALLVLPLADLPGLTLTTRLGVSRLLRPPSLSLIRSLIPWLVSSLLLALLARCPLLDALTTRPSLVRGVLVAAAAVASGGRYLVGVQHLGLVLVLVVLLVVQPLVLVAVVRLRRRRLLGQFVAVQLVRVRPVRFRRSGLVGIVRALAAAAVRRDQSDRSDPVLQVRRRGVEMR